MSVRVPEGWKKQAQFAVELKPGKPEGATAWFDTQGRPVLKTGSTWKLKAAPPVRKKPTEQNQAQKPLPKRDKPAPPKKVSKPPSAEDQAAVKAFLEKINEKIDAKVNPPPHIQRLPFAAADKQRMEPFAALDDDAKAAIWAYTSEWDTNVNSLLRTGVVRNSAKQTLSNAYVPSKSQVKKTADDLKRALDQLPDAPEQSYSRAVSGAVVPDGKIEPEPSDFMKQIYALEPGDEIEDPGFSSFTSAGAPVVDRFLIGAANSEQNAVFSIVSSRMKDISPISKYENEKEHMLPPGGKFRVVRKSTTWSRKAGNHLMIVLEHAD